MSREQQQTEEIVTLNRFREVSGELTGSVERGAYPPDFVISAGG